MSTSAVRRISPPRSWFRPGRHIPDRQRPVRRAAVWGDHHHRRPGLFPGARSRPCWSSTCRCWPARSTEDLSMSNDIKAPARTESVSSTSAAVRRIVPTAPCPRHQWSGGNGQRRSSDPGWLLVEEGFALVREHEIESIFAIGNGRSMIHPNSLMTIGSGPPDQMLWARTIASPAINVTMPRTNSSGRSWTTRVVHSDLEVGPVGEHVERWPEFGVRIVDVDPGGEGGRL